MHTRSFLFSNLRQLFRFQEPENPRPTIKKQTRRIEDYVPGYPRFTALLSAYAPFLICRRFNRLRARLLLLKQDKLSILEERLDRIDARETSPLFLGMSRYDANTDRLSLLTEIETRLADYDHFAERSHRILALDPPKPRDARSLQDWLNGTGCLARDEAVYLTHSEDLVSLAPSGDNALLQVETWVEEQLIRFWRGFRKSHHHDLSIDRNVYIYSGPLIKQIARALPLLLITFMLLMPVVVCNIVTTTFVRIIVVILSTICYLFILLELTRSRTMELILAGATYATVLIVFVSGKGNTQN